MFVEVKEPDFCNVRKEMSDCFFGQNLIWYHQSLLAMMGEGLNVRLLAQIEGAALPVK